MFEWFDDKKLVIISVVGITVVGAIFAPQMVTENFNAILAGLFGIAVGVSAAK